MISDQTNHLPMSSCVRFSMSFFKTSITRSLMRNEEEEWSESVSSSPRTSSI